MGQDFVVPPWPKEPSGVNCIRVNETRTGFIVATNKGIKAYWMDPVQIQYILEIREVGACRTAELIGGDSKFCAMACLKDKGPFKETQVRIVDMDWKLINAVTNYKSDVLGIRVAVSKSGENLFPDHRLIVILHDEIHIQLYRRYSKVPVLQLLKTGPNPNALCELSRNKLLVCPAPNKGQVQIVDLNQITEESTATPIIIQAHDSPIACLAISISGTFIATASKKGTLLRVFRTTSTKNKELELRRGCDTAVIYSISFSPCDKYVAMCSDKGTVHIFAVKDPSLNHSNVVNHVGNLLPSNLGKPFEGQKSLAQFTIQDECPSVITFLDHQTIVAITMDGEYLKYVFTPQGQCRLKILEYILNKGEDFPLKGVGPVAEMEEWIKKPGNRQKIEEFWKSKDDEKAKSATAGKAEGDDSVGKNEDEHERKSEGGENVGKSKGNKSWRMSGEFGESAGGENPEKNEGDEQFGKSAKDENAGKSEQDGKSAGGEDVGKGEQFGKSTGEDVGKDEEGEQFGKSTGEDVGKGEEGKQFRKSTGENVGKSEKSEQFGESGSENAQK